MQQQERYFLACAPPATVLAVKEPAEFRLLPEREAEEPAALIKIPAKFLDDPSKVCGVLFDDPASLPS